jgi:teichuronic acid biosynthesis glycosyltransferase TuaC
MNVLFVLGGNNKNFNVSSFIASQGKSLEDNGVNLDYFIIHGKGLKGYLGNISRLRKVLKSKKYDVIHSHYSYSAWVSVLTLTRTPQIVSFMGSDIYGVIKEPGSPQLKGSFNDIIFKLVQLFVNKIIVKSNRLGDYVFLKKKMHVVPNGVDFKKFKPIDKNYARKKIRLNSSKKQILFLGDKNNTNKNFSLLDQAIGNLDLSIYQLLPYNYPIKKELIPLYINAADVVIMSSFSEGSPNVVKETMACNVPVVSVDVGDVKEVIARTKGCYLSKYEPKDLAEKIIKAVSFKGQTTGRKDIDYLEINNIAIRLIDIYSSVKK